jgi:uncharacterized membrane protein YvbJ
MKSQKIQHANRITHRWNSKIVYVLRTRIKRLDKQQIETKIAHTNDLKKNDHANANFFAIYCVYMKSMFRARTFNLFINY